VSAETIHAIGVRFAEKMFPDFEVLISTHKDKEHCHTHFIVNSVNFETGLKIQNSYHDLKAMRDYSDELCRQHGLSVLEEWSYENKGESHSKKSEEIARRAVDGKYKSHKFDCYRAVLAAVAIAVSQDDFILQMNKSGWAVEWSDKKHITFTNHENPKQKNRYSTLAKEHMSYSDPSILGEHEALPFHDEHFKAELLARFARNVEQITKPKPEPPKPPPKPLTPNERSDYTKRIKQLNRWIYFAEVYKKYKPIDDEISRLRDSINFFNRKSVEKQIAEYELKHEDELDNFLMAQVELPDGKLTPNKWGNEIKRLQKILASDPVGQKSLQAELKRGWEMQRERGIEQRRSQPEQKKKPHEAEIQ
jgi:hypothetical protein